MYQKLHQEKIFRWKQVGISFLVEPTLSKNPFNFFSAADLK